MDPIQIRRVTQKDEESNIDPVLIRVGMSTVAKVQDGVPMDQRHRHWVKLKHGRKVAYRQILGLKNLKGDEIQADQHTITRLSDANNRVRWGDVDGWTLHRMNQTIAALIAHYYHPVAAIRVPFVVGVWGILFAVFATMTSLVLAAWGIYLAYHPPC
jgi:hypothetical protein